MRVGVTDSTGPDDRDEADLVYYTEDGERPEVTFGRCLRKLRTEIGWSQTEVAARVSALGYQQMHQTAIAKIEAGTRPLRLNEAFDIATVFRLELWEFFYITAEELISKVEDLPARIAQLENLLTATDGEIEAARLEERAALKKRALFLAELDAARRLVVAANQPGTGKGG